MTAAADLALTLVAPLVVFGAAFVAWRWLLRRLDLVDLSNPGGPATHRPRATRAVLSLYVLFILPLGVLAAAAWLVREQRPPPPEAWAAAVTIVVGPPLLVARGVREIARRRRALQATRAPAR